MLMGIWDLRGAGGDLGSQGAPEGTERDTGVPGVLIGVWGLRDAPGGTNRSSGVPGVLTEFRGPRSQVC